MTDQIEFLHLIVGRLESAGIRYMLTGSLAMSVYTQPRMTRDIDFVVECQDASAQTWMDLFQDDCYLSPEAISEAIAGEGMFNIIHLEGVTKADFIIRKNSPYRRREFERRVNKLIGGQEVAVVAAEDLFLSKLIWWKESDSAQQKLDLQVLKKSVGSLELDYIARNAAELGLSEWLRKINHDQ